MCFHSATLMGDEDGNNVMVENEWFINCRSRATNWSWRSFYSFEEIEWSI